MKDITEKNFGVIIAFLLPGFLLLWLLSISDVDVSKAGLKTLNMGDQSIGGVLTISLAALAVGMIIGAARWAIIDHFLKFVFWLFKHPLPQLPSFSKLKGKEEFATFQGIIENHYRYYQYYSNTLIAIIGAFIAHLIYGSDRTPALVWLAVIVLGLILLAASSNSLWNYRKRASELAEE